MKVGRVETRGNSQCHQNGAWKAKTSTTKQPLAGAQER